MLPYIASYCPGTCTCNYPFRLATPPSPLAAVLEANAYWRNPLKPMMSSRQLTEFYILDSEPMANGGED